MEKKVKLSYRGKEVEVYDSFSPVRLEQETQEEYKLRRKLLQDLEKLMKKFRNMLHVSCVLVPETTSEGKILKNKTTNQITWKGITKGITYIKSKEDGNTDK